MRTKIEKFNSIAHLIQTIDSRPTNRHFKYAELHSKTHGSWSGTDTYEEALNLLQAGWSPKAERLSKKVPITSSRQTTRRTKPTYSVVGGNCSVPRYLQGIPTNMIHRKQTAQKDKIVTIHKSMTYSARWSETQIEEEGIKALQIIQALENKGYRVKLVMFMSAEKNGETLISQLTVKKPEERFSLLKMAFPLAHPSMLRRILFKWIETHPEAENSFTEGYGKPDEATYKKTLKNKEILLPANIGNVDEYIKNLGL